LASGAAGGDEKQENASKNGFFLFRVIHLVIGKLSVLRLLEWHHQPINILFEQSSNSKFLYALNTSETKMKTPVVWSG
jgi:hypothetical protein